METMASQNTILTIVYSTVYSDADHRKHQSVTFDESGVVVFFGQTSWQTLDSATPETHVSGFISVFFKRALQILPSWVPKNSIYDSALIKVIAACRQKSSHYWS